MDEGACDGQEHQPDTDEAVFGVKTLQGGLLGG